MLFLQSHQLIHRLWHQHCIFNQYQCLFSWQLAAIWSFCLPFPWIHSLSFLDLKYNLSAYHSPYLCQLLAHFHSNHISKLSHFYCFSVLFSFSKKSESNHRLGLHYQTYSSYWIELNLILSPMFQPLFLNRLFPFIFQLIYSFIISPDISSRS